MVNPGEMFENAINHWRDNKGIGTALIPNPLNDKLMVLGILQKIYARSPTCNTIIITNSFSERQSITEFITQQKEFEENNEEFNFLLKTVILKFLLIVMLVNLVLNITLNCVFGINLSL